MFAEGCRRRSNTRRGDDAQSTLGPCRGGECVSCVAVNISCFGMFFNSIVPCFNKIRLVY